MADERESWEEGIAEDHKERDEKEAAQNRPSSNPMPKPAPKGYHSSDAHPMEFKSDSSLLDKFQNLVTGGASDTMKKEITPTNMNYYHEDDGKK